MFTHATLLYLFVETPLHAGSGRGLGAIDLPIQRERATGYPLVQASSIKGKLRAEAKVKADADKVAAVFGPESANASDHAGALSPCDARLLLLPVRSLAGVFAWVTSANVLARFQRDAATARVALNWQIKSPDEHKALVAPGSQAVADGKIVLEEFSYEAQTEAVVQTIGEWLASHALPPDAEYKYWRDKLPRSLVVLPENDFRDFALYATEVVTRVRLDNEKKTVESGALWTEESLPADTLLYAPLYATRPRKKADGLETGADVLNFIHNLGLRQVQLGGDETVGRGLVTVRLGEVSHD
jgi:CRISPR-associated protein Cmr4